MSNYTKTTNFTAKDSLPTGDANKKIKGVDIDTEFDAIAVAVATKADSSTVSANSPAGSILLYGGSTAPTGFLLCDGSAVSRTTYSALFAVIGTTFGTGDGSTTFNLPNFKGRAPYGVGQGNTADGGGAGTTRTLGGNIGKETHTLTTTEMPTHTHTGSTSSDGSHSHTERLQDSVDTAGGGATVSLAMNRNADDTPDYNVGTTSADGTHNHSFTTGSAGTGGSHPTVSPGLVVNFIIKT